MLLLAVAVVASTIASSLAEGKEVECLGRGEEQRVAMRMDTAAAAPSPQRIATLQGTISPTAEEEVLVSAQQLLLQAEAEEGLAAAVTG